VTRTIVIINAGDSPGLNFIRSLKRAGGWRVVGIDIDLQEYHGSEADVRYLFDWSDEDRLVEYVNEIIERHAAEFLYVADTDRELPVVSRRRDEFRAPLFLPDHTDHMLMEDKWRTWGALDAADLPVPDSALVTGRSTLADMLSRYPKVWLRRISGSAGSGSMSTTSIDFAEAWIDHQNGWDGSFMVAECLGLRTATFSGIWLNGELVASQLRERLGWKYPWLAVSGVTGITGAQRTVWDEQLHELAVACIRTVCRSPHGAIGVDFTYDDAGNPRVTELQPARFYSSMLFLAEAGINLPDLYCRLALDGRGTSPARINPVRNRVVWVKGVDHLPELLTEDQYFVDADK